MGYDCLIMSALFRGAQAYHVMIVSKCQLKGNQKLWWGYIYLLIYELDIRFQVAACVLKQKITPFYCRLSQCLLYLYDAGWGLLFY